MTLPMSTPMKLIALPTSPFAARVQIQAIEKGLDLPLEFPPAAEAGKAVDLAQHAALNPFGKIPILVVGQHAIIESAAIQEYLEDVFPSPSLRGPNPLATARMRAFIRAVDLYLFSSIFALRGLEPGSADFPPVREALARTLDRLEVLFDGHGYVCGEQLTLADCSLAPACFYLDRFLARQGCPSPRDSRPALQAWWDTVLRHDSVARVLAQLEAAVNARR